jgi:hypothetical protein
MYKGIVKLVVKNNGRIRITNPKNKGKPLEYAVKMLQLPQKFRMDNLVTADRVSLKTIDRLTETLVKFHCSTNTNSRIKRYGQPEFIKKKVDENFETLMKLNTEIAVYKLSKLHKINKELISFPTGQVSGTLSSGVLTEDKLLGPLFNKIISDLVNLMKSKSVYVAIRTTQHQHGEIQGQLNPSA